MLQTLLRSPWLLAVMALVCLGIGLGIGLLVGNRRLSKAIRHRREADAAQVAFLKNMSHDVLTPMNAIMGYTQIALKQEPQPQVRRCLEKIGESSEHLLTLMDDALTISRMEGGKVQCQPVPVDITTVFDEALSITKSFLANRTLTLNGRQEAPASPYVLADPVQLREVLVSILSNAVKFTNDGGSITFSASFFPGRDQRHMLVRYRISDTGIGMSPEFLEHLYEEFSQESPTARTQFRGTGLGMSIAKRYVQLMGGTISVESQKGVGTTFTVELPLELTEKALVQKQTLPMAQADLTGVSVLLAEDNDLNAEIAAIQLEEAGMKVTRARNGAEALMEFTGHDPGTFDVILMDIMMPEMDGCQAARIIRSLSNRPDGAVIPIIAMTANAFAEDVEACLQSGMNAHLSKPIVMPEVLKTIARNLILIFN